MLMNKYQTLQTFDFWGVCAKRCMKKVFPLVICTDGFQDTYRLHTLQHHGFLNIKVHTHCKLLDVQYRNDWVDRGNTRSTWRVSAWPWFAVRTDNRKKITGSCKHPNANTFRVLRQSNSRLCCESVRNPRKSFRKPRPGAFFHTV